ncbi:MAG: hypothetical protein FWE85_03965 [Clostridiales bacterium]|nr:hypothetical protein [Clostridiales bacterium]
MFIGMENAVEVKRGKCIYGNSTEYEVKIVRWHILYGTGDYEDPAEIRDDRDVECFYIFYEDLVKKGKFNTGSGGFLSLEEAIVSVETIVDVKWLV